jgi:hypothetical protein
VVLLLRRDRLDLTAGKLGKEELDGARSERGCSSSAIVWAILVETLASR